MQISFSNLAWAPEHDAEVAGYLHAAGVHAVDVAPGKYFPSPATATADDIAAVKQHWAKLGCTITGLQSLLFGTTGLNVFGPPDVQAALLVQLGHICRIGQGLAPAGTVLPLVFGSPKQRDKGSLTDADALAVAAEFFTRVGAVAAAHNVQVCLEPNPTFYGCNFMTDAASTAAVVQAVNHPAIRLQLDTGAATLNGEELESYAAYLPLVGHLHASEPALAGLGQPPAEGQTATNHAAWGAWLAGQNVVAHHTVAIEMLAPAGLPPAQYVPTALRVAAAAYGAPHAA